MVEWRARRFADPVERLQFLRQKLASDVQRGRSRKRFLLCFPVPAITLGLALAGGTLLQPFAKRALGWTPSPVAPPSTPVAGFRKASAAAGGPRSQPKDASAVWIVERDSHSDLYSNGLRVENQFVTSGTPRKYMVFSATRPDSAASRWRTNPAGIVFHTTESHMAPFEEDQNNTLKRAGEGLLQYVSRRKSYHFVIDRFGRVFRIVGEGDAANHAGNSIWADQSWVYVNLNNSFFGVAFEAQTTPDGDGEPVNAAQIYAARILTEMLRARYGISASNCVAHAQVSVNPGNRRAGYHTDWAANLPFAALGLTDNYSRPLPSITLFGFEPDRALADSGALSAGIQAGEDQIARQAAARGVAPDRYRQSLQKEYRDIMQALRSKGAYEENN